MTNKETPEPSSSQPKVVGTSAGGSRLLKYGGREFEGSKVGFTEESTAELMELREKIYLEIFGESDSVLHEFIPFIPHIDVYRFPPSGHRNYFTYVTGGVSDIPMTIPDGAGTDHRRVELAFYAAADRPEHSELIRRLAHFPHDNSTWLHWWHTMPNGMPPEPLFDSGPLDSFFFMPSIVEPDSQLGKRLVWQGEPIHLVWCLPITTAECNFKLEKGTDAFLDLLQQREHPFVFSGQRPSYV